jgi:predicted metalloprotease with PDZ domain
MCSLAVCRGNFIGSSALDSVILVDGDIDLTRSSDLRNSLIRATGEIRLPRGVKPQNCDIQAHAKNATVPYKFFELADVGLSAGSHEKGVAVAAVKANTPFGDAGLAAGDLIRAIDDAPAGTPEEFRKNIRRAMVRQGDCLLTVARGDKTLDVPVFFPLPK